MPTDKRNWVTGYTLQVDEQEVISFTKYVNAGATMSDIISLAKERADLFGVKNVVIASIDEGAELVCDRFGTWSVCHWFPALLYMSYHSVLPRLAFDTSNMSKYSFNLSADLERG